MAQLHFGPVIAGLIDRLPTVGGASIAFLCATIAVGANAQTEVKARFGSGLHGTSILLSKPGLLFLAFWGLVDAVFFMVFVNNHDWAKRAFNIEVEDNVLMTVAVVGLSAILIIRTNLATVGSVQLGGELVYSWSRSYLIDQLNRKRVSDRRAFMQRYRSYYRDVAGYPNYLVSLGNTLTNLAGGSANAAKIKEDFAKLKTEAAANAIESRESLTGLVYDYFGPKAVDDWAKVEDYGNT